MLSCSLCFLIIISETYRNNLRGCKMQEPSTLRAPLLSTASTPSQCFSSRCAAIVVVITLSVAAVVRVAQFLWHSTLPDEIADIVILGVGGAYWSNGVQAMAASGTLTWACKLSNGGLALVEEDTATLWDWHSEATTRRTTLHHLRRPVQCVQHDTSLYVACFGMEEEAGHSGIAVLDVDSWSVRVERALRTTTHVHHVYPLPSAEAGAIAGLLFTDVGDPWVEPPVLGGVYHIHDARLQMGVEPTRVGPPMHSRAAVLPPSLSRAPGDEANVEGGATLLYVITQEPHGEATRVVALDGGDWSGSVLSASVAALLQLPRPALPSDGGADIFTLRGRLFVSDRYGGNGSLYELGWSAGRLDVLTSVELGVHPRYTDPLGTGDTIYSVSRDDGLLTIIDASSATLAVRAQRRAHVALPAFLARYSA